MVPPQTSNCDLNDGLLHTAKLMKVSQRVWYRLCNSVLPALLDPVKMRHCLALESSGHCCAWDLACSQKGRLLLPDCVCADVLGVDRLGDL